MTRNKPNAARPVSVVRRPPKMIFAPANGHPPYRFELVLVFVLLMPVLRPLPRVEPRRVRVRVRVRRPMLPLLMLRLLMLRLLMLRLLMFWSSVVPELVF